MSGQDMKWRTGKVAELEQRIIIRNNLISPRKREAQALRKQGNNYRQIGKLIGVSINRAREMVIEADQFDKDAANPAWHFGLTSRSKNCLLAGGFESLSQVAEHIRKHGDLPKLTNLGKGSRTEIITWL